MMGALPIPDDIHGLAKLKKAIEYRSKKGNPIVIYPEAHLWPYYTKIREFSNVSFHYPVELDTTVYSMTTTYKKKGIDVYIDGPFYMNKDLSKKDNIELFKIQVSNKLKSRSKLNEVEHITYKKKD